MNRLMLIVPVFLALALSASSCGQVVAVRHDMLPPGISVGALEPKDPAVVALVQQGVRPEKGCVRLAKLSAKGDPYTKRDALEQSLKLEGAKIGADFVVVTGYREIEDNSTPHFVEYGTGIPLADDVRNPYLYGFACRESKVRLGTDLSKDWIVRRVAPGSLAEQIGLQQGDRLMSVNGTHLSDHEYAYDQNLLSRPPGERVVIEYFTKEGRRVSRDVTLEAAP
jgi:membrane-associated protease RseP (regulator of RpoE activity)